MPIGFNNGEFRCPKRTLHPYPGCSWNTIKKRRRTDRRFITIKTYEDTGNLAFPSSQAEPVKAYMNTNVKSIEPGKSPVHATNLMVKHDIGRLPVVANGKIIGIVTRSDIMHYFYDVLPD